MKHGAMSWCSRIAVGRQVNGSVQETAARREIDQHVKLQTATVNRIKKLRWKIWSKKSCKSMTKMY